MAEFLMPSLGADMSAGTLVAWHKKPGDPVTKGDVIAEVDTDKAVIEIEAFTTGVFEKVLVQTGTKVPVGTPLALIREESRPAGAPPKPETPSPSPAAGPSKRRGPTPAAQAAPVQATPEAGRLRISPSARQLAAELGVDPATVRGTGPEGAVTRRDIEQAATAKAKGQGREAREVREVIGKPAVEPIAQGPSPGASAAEAGDRQVRMRQAIAAAMARSKREVPHYYLSTTIDMSPALTWMQETNAKRPVSDRLLYGVLLIKAVALALREVPELNARWAEGQAVPSKDIHVGVAISLRQGGLVAPALHNTDDHSLEELMRMFRDLVKRARAGSLRGSELADPTITVTSLGEQGIETVFGVIYPPQVALVGFGKVVERPWVVEGKLVPRPVITATLSADHRVSDGHRGGLFLGAVERLLQEPGQL